MPHGKYLPHVESVIKLTDDQRCVLGGRRLEKKPDDCHTVGKVRGNTVSHRWTGDKTGA